jgi:uncharacterized sulfatase
MKLLLLFLALLASGVRQDAPESADAEPGDARPNVVLIAWDGLDARALRTVAGLRALAEEGTVLDAHVPVSRGRASQLALLEGRWPQAGAKEATPGAKTDATLGASLAQAGYATLAAGRLPRAAPALGFEAAGDPADAKGRARLLERIGRAVGGDERRPFLLWWAPSAPAGRRKADPAEEGLALLVAHLRALGEHERTLYVVVDERSRDTAFGPGSARETSLATPLLLAGPVTLAPPGERGLVTTLDVPATVLAAAGLAVPEGVAGRSLLAGTDGERAPRELVHGVLVPGASTRSGRLSGGGRRTGRGTVLEPGALYARGRRWKYVLELTDLVEETTDYTFAYPVSAGRERLFDLEADPEERHDLSGHPQHAERRAALRRGLLAWWKRSGGGELELPPLFGGLAPPPEADRPNIVLVLSDDHDNRHLGFEGNQLVRMPTLDRLAAEGIVFGGAHVPMSRCRPSLAALLDGRYPHQNGILDNQTDRTLRRKNVLPELLKRAGYATFMGGKFWEGNHHSMGFVAPERQDRNGFVREGQAELLAFLDEHAGTRPLFVWWAPLLPHGPFEPPERFARPFAEAQPPLPEGFRGDAQRYREAERTLFAMEAWFDDGLRELEDALGERGELDDTLFVFLIDNGWSNYRPSKGSVFEQGLRTPLFFSGAGLDAGGGRRIDVPVSTVDVYPTLLELAGVRVPGSAAGRSLLPLVAGRETPEDGVVCGAAFTPPRRGGATRPERDVYALYARTTRWKYVLYLRDVRPERSKIHVGMGPFPARDRGDAELYDLVADPHELEALSGPEHEEVAARLRRHALDWWRTTGGPELDLPR